MSAVLTFSDPTIGRLADLAPRVSKERLKILLRHADLWRFAPQSSSGNSSKPALLMESLDQANLAADAGDATAHQSLLDFVQALIDELRPLLSGLTTQIAALAEALRADGYELQVPAGLYDAARLLPTEPSAAPLP